MRGFSLAELVVVLVLAALLAGALPIHLGGLRDRLAVRAAREASVGLVARARQRAILTGGAELRIQEDPPRLTVPGGDAGTLRLDLRAEHGVELEIPGPARRATVRFDALGIGRMASRTLRFHRRGAEASLTLSAYGRVRRR